MITKYKQPLNPLPFKMNEAKELIADSDVHSLRRIALGYATLAHGGAVNYLEMKNENERLQEEMNKYRDRAIEMAKLIIQVEELEEDAIAGKNATIDGQKKFIACQYEEIDRLNSILADAGIAA